MPDSVDWVWIAELSIFTSTLRHAWKLAIIIARDCQLDPTLKQFLILRTCKCSLHTFGSDLSLKKSTDESRS